MAFRANIPRCTANCKNDKPCTAYRKKGHDYCARHCKALLPDTADSEKAISKETDEEDNECPICYESVAKGTDHVLQCKHRFHRDCLKKWVEMLKNTCPTCRGVMSKKDVTRVSRKRRMPATQTRQQPQRPAANMGTFVFIAHTEEGSLYAWVDENGRQSNDVIVVT